MLGPLDLGFSWPAEEGMNAVTQSSYSPLALRDLPQPRPNDAPSDLDTSIFTFEDAFEDLLTVSQGQPLPDIKSRYEQRKLLRSMFPNGEPGYFWLRRLRSQGLVEESGPAKLLKSAANQNWDQFHQELDRSAQAVWRNVLNDDNDEEESGGTFGNHEQYDRSKRGNTVSSHQRNEERYRHNEHNSASYEMDELRDELHGNQNRQRQANDFDDLFSAIQSSFANGHSAWDSFIKLINEDRPAPSKREHQQLQEPESDEKQVVSKDEYVDRFGYLHTKTLVKTLDENGDEIGSHSHYTVRPAQRNSENARIGEQDKEGQESGFKATGNLDIKKGWFWK
ncbi:Ff.00g076350.m01.CDS01 [Fusarium sp. VM40]|nr:Ff.00g076350.m01.CDS01 [Fusarium sp. VM40]